MKNLLILVLISCMGGTTAMAQENPIKPLNVPDFVAEMKQHGDKDALAPRIRAWFGEKNLANGANPKVGDLQAVFAIAAPDAKSDPIVVNDEGATLVKLRRLGKSDIYAGNFAANEGAYVRWTYKIGTESKASGNFEAYTTPPEMKRQPGVPEGKLLPQKPWVSQIYAGTTRDWWIYVPAQYTPDKPACVMVFQDGIWAKDYAPVCFDNLIAKKEIPVTICVFVSPGTFIEGNRSNRSIEYDTMSDKYGRYIIEEILPEVEKTYKLRQDAQSRAAAGLSSGGIASFSMAWYHPEKFHKVLSWIGSYVNLQGGETGIGGGHNYPTLIRKSKENPKPIRVFLQDGAHDLDNPFGNWPLANQQMDKALTYSGYDHKFVFGNGEHNDRHGRAVMPDALRWLWRGVPVE